MIPTFVANRNETLSLRIPRPFNNQRHKMMISRKLERRRPESSHSKPRVDSHDRVPSLDTKSRMYLRLHVPFGTGLTDFLFQIARALHVSKANSELLKR
jgi:hypothetical protein